MPNGLFNIESGNGGLPKVVVTAPDGARIEVYLHGATLTSWIPAGGDEQLYVSQTSYFESDKPIRGGVPVCFPQFGARGPLPLMHGFARQVSWMFAGAESVEDRVRARLVKMADDQTRHWWQFEFQLALDITFGGTQLDVALSVTNPGSLPFQFGAALHTYFAVSEVASTTVEGLQGCPYTDHTTGDVPRLQSAPTIPFDGLVNSFFASAPDRAVIREPHRTLEVIKEGFPDVVVWNAGAEKGATIADLEPDGYRKYVCVESVVASTPVALQPGGVWRGVQRIRV